MVMNLDTDGIRRGEAWAEADAWFQEFPPEKREKLLAALGVVESESHVGDILAALTTLALLELEWRANRAKQTSTA